MTYWKTIVHQHWVGFFASIPAICKRFPDKEEVLHTSELDVLAHFRSKTYRDSWFAGRVLAKKMYMERSLLERPVEWRDLRIISRNSSGQSIAPRLLIQDRNVDFAFSLSHVADKAVAVTSTEPDDRIGCDLVYRNTTTPGIVNMFFHNDEAREHQNFDAIWAVKEAAYKSCNEGNPFQPRRWLTQRIGERCYFCRYLNKDRQFYAKAETIPIGEYMLAVARKSTVCYTLEEFSG